MPIPQPPKKFTFYFVPANPESGLANQDCAVTIRLTESVHTFRQAISEYLKINKDAFLIGKVYQGKVTALFNSN